MNSYKLSFIEYKNEIIGAFFFTTKYHLLIYKNKKIYNILDLTNKDQDTSKSIGYFKLDILPIFPKDFIISKSNRTVSIQKEAVPDR